MYQWKQTQFMYAFFAAYQYPLLSCTSERAWKGPPYFAIIACLAGPAIHAATAIYASKESITFIASPKGVC